MTDFLTQSNIYIVISLSILIGFAIAWLLKSKSVGQLQQKNQELERELALASERRAHLDSRITELNDDISQSRQELNNAKKQNESLSIDLARLQTRFEAEQKAAQEKLALLEQAEKKMADAFENLSNRILEEKTKRFTEQNKTNIGEVLNPLREQLDGFKKKIEDVYVEENKERNLLRHEITSLKSLNEQMSKDAINLTNALKGESKTRGNWGEVILERVLENSGLTKGREYEVQGSYRDENGKLYYPDVLVHLPNQRDVVIDSKISLNAYERYYAAEDEQARSLALKEHLNSIRTHVTQLKSKSYDELIGVNSLDMVLMFVPIEPALMLAFEQDDQLFQEAFKNGIFLVSPSTLSMNLQIIQNMWRHEYQNRNAQEIADRASKLYEKFVGFVEALHDVGEKIGKAQDAYDTAHKRLIDGRGNLVSQVESIRKLGDLKISKSLPDNLLEQSDSDD